MSEQPTSIEEEKIRRITMRLAQMQAKSALRAMKSAVRARTRQKREHAHRRNCLGEAVMQAGLGEWKPAEVLGLLLAGRDHFGVTETARALFAQRAQRHQSNAHSSSLH